MNREADAAAAHMRLVEFLNYLVGWGKGRDLLARIRDPNDLAPAALLREVAAGELFEKAYKLARVTAGQSEGFAESNFAAVQLPAETAALSFAEAFEQVYAPRLGERRDGFTALFAALTASNVEPPLLVETGTLRLAGNWAGDGQSTFLFDRYVRGNGGRVFSIDINAECVETARRVCSGATIAMCADSVIALQTLASVTDRKVSLLYLDSFDLDAADPMPSAIHHGMELAAAMPMLGPGSLVAVDDYAVAGNAAGGKGLIVDRYMDAVQAEVVHSGYQKIWRL